MKKVEEDIRMIDDVSRQARGMPATKALSMPFKTAAHPFASPQTLAGTWPPIDGHGSGDQLQHVVALDAVAAASTPFFRKALQSLRSRASTSAKGALSGLRTLIVGRPDSQGRMDLSTMLPQKLKQFVNPTAAGDVR